MHAGIHNPRLMQFLVLQWRRRDAKPIPIALKTLGKLGQAQSKFIRRVLVTAMPTQWVHI